MTYCNGSARTERAKKQCERGLTLNTYQILYLQDSFLFHGAFRETMRRICMICNVDNRICPGPLPNMGGDGGEGPNTAENFERANIKSYMRKIFLRSDFAIIPVSPLFSFFYQ